MRLTNEERFLLRDALSRYPQAFTPLMNDLYIKLGEEDDTVYILVNEDVDMCLEGIEDSVHLTADEKELLYVKVNENLNNTDGMHDELYWATFNEFTDIIEQRDHKPEPVELKGKFIEPKGTME